MPAEETEMANTLEETPKPATKPREGRAPKLAAQRDADATSPEDGIVRAGPDDDASTERVSSLASAPAIRTTPARRGVVRRSLPWVLVALATAAAVVFALLWRNAD
jgi:hypothetical protein